MVVGLSAAALLTPLYADPAFDEVVEAKVAPLPSSATLQQTAQNHYETLLDKGVEAYHIQFDWGYRTVGEYQASLVVFRDAQGRHWAKLGSKMKWLSGKTPSEWVQNLFPDKVTQIFAVQRRYDPDEIAFLQTSLAPQTKMASD